MSANSKDSSESLALTNQCNTRLWEGSWADDALIANTETQTLTDPKKVRKISHHGKYLDCESAFQVSPSPQRTPVLFQAGMSP